MNCCEEADLNHSGRQSPYYLVPNNCSWRIKLGASYCVFVCIVFSKPLQWWPLIFMQEIYIILKSLNVRSHAYRGVENRKLSHVRPEMATSSILFPGAQLEVFFFKQFCRMNLLDIKYRIEKSYAYYSSKHTAEVYDNHRSANKF